jgi:Uma2 family endonuclease
MDAMNAELAHEMTIAEWAAMDEDEPGELVDGVLVEDEMPDSIHEIVVTWFVHVLSTWLAGRGFVLGSEAKFKVRPRRGRKPDVSVYLPGRKPEPRGAISRPPDIMIEVVTPTPRDGRRDRVEKVEDYAVFGVKMYWIVDPELRTLEVLELGADGRYAHALGAIDVCELSPLGCPGLVLDLTALWSEVDRLLEGEGA